MGNGIYGGNNTGTDIKDQIEKGTSTMLGYYNNPEGFYWNDSLSSSHFPYLVPKQGTIYSSWVRMWFVANNSGNDGISNNSEGDITAGGVGKTGVRFYINNKESLLLFKYTPHVTVNNISGGNALFDEYWREWDF